MVSFSSEVALSRSSLEGWVDGASSPSWQLLMGGSLDSLTGDMIGLEAVLVDTAMFELPLKVKCTPDTNLVSLSISYLMLLAIYVISTQVVTIATVVYS